MVNRMLYKVIRHEHSLSRCRSLNSGQDSEGGSTVIAAFEMTVG